MKLYLAQHGPAIDKKIDPDRPLSTEGRSQVENVARYFRSLNIKIPQILHSGKTRAVQTAEIFADVLASAIPNRLDGLSPNDPAQPIAKALNEWENDSMIVGHFPFMPHMLSHLLTGAKPSDTDAMPGNIVWLEKLEMQHWSLAGSCAYDDFDTMINNNP